jgi:transcription initiation factor TFIIIB Brf1 subunit/transcription initiation factor TFIIB
MNMQDITSCPDCGSMNIIHGQLREQIICRDCGLIFEPLAVDLEEKKTVAETKRKEVKPRAAKKPKKKPKKKVKKKAKKKPKKKAKKKAKKKVKKAVKKKPKKKVKKKAKKKAKKKSKKFGLKKFFKGLRKKK